MGNIKELFSILKDLLEKYRRDNAFVIVAAIAFYILLTFIPFTLLATSILGYIIDLSDLDEHFLVYLSKAIPDPYNETVTRIVTSNFNLVETWKHVSGPLGLFFLFYFTSKLFSVLIPSFRTIFGQRQDNFFRQKGKEFLFTMLFSALQVVVFFMTVVLFVMSSHLVSTISNQEHSFLEGHTHLYLFSCLDMLCMFTMFFLLYYMLTPTRKHTWLLLGSTLLATVLWALGKTLFKYFVLHVARLTNVFGAYGVYVAFLFWIYYSVFVLVVCAELQSVLLLRDHSRGH